MTRPNRPVRPLGTMITYGFPRGDVEIDLAIASQLGASCVEILPHWEALPDPRSLRSILVDHGPKLHSVHGCWGGRSIRAPRVDLGSTDPETQRASRDDLRACLDWMSEAGGRFLVVHPGGFSDESESSARRDALANGLIALADHIAGTDLVVCVENMPPGVFPGSKAGDLHALVAEINRPEIALALDTGHAHIAETLDSGTLDSGRLLRTTHVHDNDGRQDNHLPPGLGTIDWKSWPDRLDSIGYEGPIMLECIRHLRNHPESITAEFLGLLDRLRRRSSVQES